MASRLARIAVLVMHLIVSFSDASSVTLLSMPEPGPGWSWKSSKDGPRGGWTGSEGKSSQRTCDPKPKNSTNNWLRSSIINVTEVKMIFIGINYTMRKCSLSRGHFCRENLTLHAYRATENENACDEPKNGGYEQIGTIAAEKLRNSSSDYSPHNRGSWTLTIKPNTVYVCLAVHDQGACATFWSFLVSYKVCPAFKNSATLVLLPRTVAPANESHALKVNGSCSKVGTDSKDTDTYGYCESDGEWNTTLHEGHCLCKPGFGNINSRCQVCRSGTYKADHGNSECTICPAGSLPNEEGTRCNCNNDLYRAPGEDYTYNCTGPPSQVENVRIAFQNGTTAIITWMPPRETGGRTDLRYHVDCSEECGSNSENCSPDCDFVSFSSGKSNLTTNRVALGSLDPTVTYTIRIRAENGVSQVAGVLPTWSGLVTIYSVPNRPNVTFTIPTENLVLVKWSMESNTVGVDFWVVSCNSKYENKSSRTSTLKASIKTKTFMDLHPNRNYTIQVQGNNSRGLGMVGEAVFDTTTSGIKDERKADTNKKNTVIVAVTVAGALFVLIVTLALLVMLQRRSSTRIQANNRMFGQGSEMTSREQYIDPNNYDNPLDLLKDFASEINRNRIKLEDIVGGGEFADVYRGSLKTAEGLVTVAIKVLKQGSTLKNKGDFLFEASIMGQFQHPNVIRLEGIVTKTRPMMIVTEFMENGSLLDILKSHKKLLTHLQLIGMARGVAVGMTYLSGMNFIHRDLAARNVLVGENMMCKVADFGLSRELSDDPESEYQTQGGKIAIRWTAPEALRHRTFCPASDVWSFGIVLWEIMSFAERPFWDWDNLQVMDQVQGGYRLPAPPDCPQAIHNIMVECWNLDKNSRPKFAEIVRMLDVFIRSPEQLRRSVIPATRRTSPNFNQVRTLQEWLESIKMEMYLSHFQQAGYTELHDVARLDLDDLHGIGITLIGHRNKISKSIKQMHLHFNNLAYEAC